MKKSEILHEEENRKIQQLFRVQMLIDVIYGLTIFHLFRMLPKPSQEHIEEKALMKMFAESGTTLGIMLVGIILTLTYWSQSNRQFGYLKKSDNRHAVLAIVQMLCILIYLYFMGLENQTEGLEITLIMQSIFLALAGFIGVFSWNYADRNKFFIESMTKKKSIEIMYSFLSEPIAATLTIPFALFGSDWYMIGWLIVIPLGIILKRRKKKKLATLE
jgi:uncharacterized membrane protein